MAPGERGPANDLHIQVQKRQKLRDQVRERFSRYGDKPCARIVEAALQTHGLQRLLELLGIPTGAHLDQQLDQLTRYLSENGPRHFMNCVAQWDRKRGIANDHEAAAPVADRPVPATTDPAPIQTRIPPSGDVTPPEWFNARGKYIGPERRKTTDRRSGIDRRDRVDSINKNKRYGGDRRKQMRRREDRINALENPPKGH